MTDGYNEKWNNNAEYPLPINTSKSLLEDTDIVCSRILGFFRAIIRDNLNARWAEQCNKVGLTSQNLKNLTDGYAVGDAICYPPATTLQQTDYRFPLLSVHRQGGEVIQISSTRLGVSSDFLVTWTLPPLNSPEQMNAIYPFLQAVVQVIAQATTNGSDPRYQNGELVWKDAGFAWASLNQVKYGQYLGNDGKTIYPSVAIHFTVFEKTSIASDNYEQLEDFDSNIDHVDPSSPNAPINDFIVEHVNPSMTVAGFSPSSVDAAGGQLLQITGTGFGEIASIELVTSDGSRLILSENFRARSERLILAVTASVPSAISGKVVVTDKQGQTAESSNDFFFTKFDPMTLGPAWYVAPGDYSAVTGVWTASIGPNLKAYGGAGSLPNPPAVNGCPNMLGDDPYHYLVDQVAADSTGASWTPFDSWSSADIATGRHWAVLCNPLDQTAYGNDPTAYYNNTIVISDYNIYVCIALRWDSTTNTYWAHFQDYEYNIADADLHHSASIDISSFVNAEGQGSLFLQARKTETGLMQIRCNESGWVSGDVGVNTDAAATGPALGETKYKGLIKAAASYRRALSDVEADQLWHWSQGE